MLKGLHPVLSADLLHLLASMGHGDDIAIVDGNFPGATIAAATTSGKLVRLPGLCVHKVLEAVLTVLPLDDFTDDPVRFMQVVGNAAGKPEAIVAMELTTRDSGYAGAFVSLERHAFYGVAKSCFGIVQSGEQALYGNVILRKGLVSVPYRELHRGDASSRALPQGC